MKNQEGLDKLHSGDYNNFNCEYLPDNVVIVTIEKRGEGKLYRFKVRDLNGEHEEVLEHEVIENKPPQFILDRMKEAREHGSKDSAKSG